MKPIPISQDVYHRCFRTPLFRLVAICSLWLMSAIFASAQSYTVTDLGTLGGDYSVATSINNHGQVVGVSTLSDNQTFHAFVWQQGTMTDLDAMGGSSYPEGINDNGQIVGNSTGGAFLWQNNSRTMLGFNVANSINNKGQVVGFDAVNGYNAVLWQNGIVTDLNPMSALNFSSNFNFSTALGINDNGQIVGLLIASLPGGFESGFIWQNGVTTLLGTLGSNNGVAWAINNNQQVVGYSFLPGDTVYHAVLWQSGEITDLGTLGGANSIAYGINASGDIVGEADTATDHHLFLWQNGVMKDLNDLIPPDSGWVFNALGPDGTTDKFVAINNVGQIAGIGNYNGHPRAFLLTPTGGSSGPVVQITNVTASNLSLTGATISWNTNVPANSTVEYGYTDSYGSSVTTSALVTNHSITLNLLPDRIYHYRVISTTTTGQTATSGDQTFATEAGPYFYMTYANLHKACTKMASATISSTSPSPHSQEPTFLRLRCTGPLWEARHRSLPPSSSGFPPTPVTRSPSRFPLRPAPREAACR
jgi:probable HAF family extracellular repeat protein